MRNSNKFAILIYIVAFIILAVSLCTGFYYISDDEMLTGAIFCITGIAASIILGGFGNIIDLLNSINNKLDKTNK